jgi:hypothetical protein
MKRGGRHYEMMRYCSEIPRYHWSLKGVGGQLTDTTFTGKAGLGGTAIYGSKIEVLEVRVGGWAGHM